MITLTVVRREEDTSQDHTSAIRTLWLKPLGNVGCSDFMRIYVGKETYDENPLGTKYELRRMPTEGNSSGR
jgi:hypothetical protein